MNKKLSEISIQKAQSSTLMDNSNNGQFTGGV